MAQKLCGRKKSTVGRPARNTTLELGSSMTTKKASRKDSTDAVHQRDAISKDGKRKRIDDTTVETPSTKKAKTITIASTGFINTSSPIPASPSTPSSLSSARTISAPSTPAPPSSPAASSYHCKHMRGAVPAALTPLPGKPDYSQFSYPQITALCRACELPRKGNTAVLRNLLIQDDIDVEQGNERNLSGETPSRKRYKTVAPMIE